VCDKPVSSVANPAAPVSQLLLGSKSTNQLEHKAAAAMDDNDVAGHAGHYLYSLVSTCDSLLLTRHSLLYSLLLTRDSLLHTQYCHY
jgi:hypothetical protein